MFKARLKIAKPIWDGLLQELKIRGDAQRESGAYLLGSMQSGMITDFICFDDLDPHCLEKGYIIFDSSGFVPLWQRCNERNLSVLADVHTHPRRWTGLSDLDIEHPMVHQKGHIGLIIPNYAMGSHKDLKGIGVHEYLGSKKWKTWKVKSKIFQIIEQ
jgi:proteasome lid subunit RPN8/RPN11